jgi:hypothetical protein
VNEIRRRGGAARCGRDQPGSKRVRMDDVGIARFRQLRQRPGRSHDLGNGSGGVAGVKAETARGALDFIDVHAEPSYFVRQLA